METIRQNNDPITDQLMLERIRENDDRAFDMLYKKYWKPLLHFAAYYINDRDTCEEITQELFIQLHNRRHTLRINASVASYLHTALRNKIFNYIRDQAVYKKHINIAAHKSTGSQNNVDQFISMKELQEEISVSLKCMPLKCKEVYLLHDRDDFTVKKISQMLSRPVDTVEKQLRRAKTHLRNSLLSTNEYATKNKMQTLSGPVCR
jgi:RNA polymerase sigma-70 factor (ECF subfamily)